MKTFTQFIAENNKLPYYSSDQFASVDHHTEHMLLQNFPQYRKAFETKLDDNGSHMDAHREGVTAVLNIPRPEPHWDGNSYVQPDHPIEQIFKMNTRVKPRTAAELGANLDIKA